jgi:hypothetical protein
MVKENRRSLMANIQEMLFVNLTEGTNCCECGSYIPAGHLAHTLVITNRVMCRKCVGQSVLSMPDDLRINTSPIWWNNPGAQYPASLLPDKMRGVLLRSVGQKCPFCAKDIKPGSFVFLVYIDQRDVEVCRMCAAKGLLDLTDED